MFFTTQHHLHMLSSSPAGSEDCLGTAFFDILLRMSTTARRFRSLHVSLLVGALLSLLLPSFAGGVSPCSCQGV